MPPKASGKKSAKSKEKKERELLEERIKNSDAKCAEAQGFITPAGKNPTPNFPKAKAALDAACELYDANPNIYFILGEYYRLQNLIGEAVQEYSRALDLCPTMTRALETRGMCYKKLHQLDLAIEDFTSVIEAEPDNDHAYNMRGLCVAMGRVPGLRLKSAEFKRCEDDFKDSIRLNPSNFYAHANLGKLYEDQGELEKALESYTSSLTIKKDYRYALFRRGCVGLILGSRAIDQEEASNSENEEELLAPATVSVEDKEGSRRTSPTPQVTLKDVEAEIKVKLAREEELTKGKQNLEKAVKDFESLLPSAEEDNDENTSKDVMAPLNLGICYLCLGDLNKTEDNFKLVDEMLASNTIYTNNYGDAGDNNNNDGGTSESQKARNVEAIRKVLAIQKQKLKNKKLLRAQAQM